MESYAIRIESLSRQLSDTPKLMFFLVLWALMGLAFLKGGGVWRAGAIGGFFGTLPSLRLGLAASIAVQGNADWSRAEQWLERTGHCRKGAAWAPPLPRLLYFNTQIVRYADGRIHGPLVLLRRLRKVLLDDVSGHP